MTGERFWIGKREKVKEVMKTLIEDINYGVLAASLAAPMRREMRDEMEMAWR
jgi:hypothetical protein